MMPPPLHLSDIRRKCFPYGRCYGKQNGAGEGQPIISQSHSRLLKIIANEKGVSHY